jgi:L,D-transpeptidase YcbB
VNLADFSAKIVDDGRVTFETRAVVGATPGDRQSPEFSDEMEHMIVNPSWHVPRSIAVNEYLPSFRRNPYANSHLTIYYRGQPVARDRINWPVVTAANWPFALKQAPSRSNALGLVKFMFPNQWNIYLHDTPEKHLFDRSARAFSHGCIRLQRPFELAHALLSRQTDDPDGLFESRLNTGRETRIDLDQHVPVHLVYRTALTTPRGELRFRPDIYGRDRAILAALEEAGVVIADLPS